MNEIKRDWVLIFSHTPEKCVYTFQFEGLILQAEITDIDTKNEIVTFTKRLTQPTQEKYEEAGRKRYFIVEGNGVEIEKKFKTLYVENEKGHRIYLGGIGQQYGDN